MSSPGERTGPTPWLSGWMGPAAALFALAVGPVGPGAGAALRGQDSVQELARACGGGSQEVRSWCTEVALALEAARGGVGLLSAGGTELPGSAGTLGWRLGSVPRLSVAGRVQLGRLTVPEILDAPRRPAPERSFTVTSLHAAAGVGLFDGFSLLPTVGGLLAVDLIGTGSLVFLPESEGFDASPGSLGVGARLGLLRESFTLPGLSISAVRRWSRPVRLGVLDEGAPGEARFDLTTTSIRATVGKDLLGIGVLAGVGWDRYSGEASIRARDPAIHAPGDEGSAIGDDLATSRTLFFAGASLDLLVLQLSTEGGWARGYDPVAARGPGGYDPSGGTPFGSVALRLLF